MIETTIKSKKCLMNLKISNLFAWMLLMVTRAHLLKGLSFTELIFQPIFLLLEMLSQMKLLKFSCKQELILSNLESAQDLFVQLEDRPELAILN